MLLMQPSADEASTMPRVHLATIHQSVAAFIGPALENTGDISLQEPYAQICLNADDCISSWEFKTRQQAWWRAFARLREDNEHLTAQPQEVTQQQLLPWVTRQDTRRIPTSSALTHLTPPPFFFSSSPPIWCSTLNPPPLSREALLQACVAPRCLQRRGRGKEGETGGVNPISARWACQAVA